MPGQHRRFLFSFLLATVAVPAVASAAVAPAAPPLMPTRDATVVYSVQPDGVPQPQKVTVYFQGGGGLMRIDGPPGPPDGSPSGFMVMNRAAKSMIVVMNQPRAFMDVPEAQEVRSPFVLDPSMRFTPEGSGSVAGIACTRYAIVAGTGQAQACVTADGVVLSESGVDGQGNRGSLSAQTVTYAPLSPTVFTPPAGFERVAHPAGPGPNGGMVPGQDSGPQGLSPNAPPMPNGNP